MRQRATRAAVMIGGFVPFVPRDDFTKIPVKALDDAWEIVGPSVEKNINNFPLHKVIAAAYLEGVNHGYGIAQRQQQKDTP